MNTKTARIPVFADKRRRLFFSLGILLKPPPPATPAWNRLLAPMSELSRDGLVSLSQVCPDLVVFSPRAITVIEFDVNHRVSGRTGTCEPCVSIHR